MEQRGGGEALRSGSKAAEVKERACMDPMAEVALVPWSYDSDTDPAAVAAAVSSQRASARNRRSEAPPPPWQMLARAPR